MGRGTSLSAISSKEKWRVIVEILVKFKGSSENPHHMGCVHSLKSVGKEVIDGSEGRE